MPLSIGQPKGPSSCGVISRVVTNAAGHADRDLRKILSRNASPFVFIFYEEGRRALTTQALNDYQDHIDIPYFSPKCYSMCE
jgi:hypothetical protein